MLYLYRPIPTAELKHRNQVVLHNLIVLKVTINYVSIDLSLCNMLVDLCAVIYDSSNGKLKILKIEIRLHGFRFNTLSMNSNDEALHFKRHRIKWFLADAL